MAPVPRLLSVSKMAFGAQFISQLEHYTLRLLINEAVPLVPTVKRDAFKRMMSSSPISSGLLWTAKYKGLGLEHHSCRFSTISSTPDDVVMHELLHFIRSALDKHEGTDHCWLNKNGKALFRKDGPYVVLVGVFLEDAMLNHYHEHHFMFERLKSLQRKYPVLQVFGFQPGCPVHSLATQSMVIKTIMEEYITFPILLSEKNFGLSNEPCYLLLENFASSLIHREWDVDPEVIVKDLEGFDLLCGGDAATVTVSSNMKVDHAEFEDEPSACSPLRNLLLFYPCCISADDCGNRLFLSDTNHHRIIVTDLDGKVIDCIGSSPGFEDGEFGTAKLLRPAGSLYDGSEDCLYFVDSENHAVRRADMGKRVLETLYPVHNRGSSGVWSWILDKLGLGKTFQTEFKEFEKVFLSNPWHLLKSREEDLLVFSRSFETLWVISMDRGEIKNVCEGLPKIMEIHGQTITERASHLERVSTHLPQEGVVPNFSSLKLPYAGFMSSLSSLQNNIIFCDPVRQRVFRCQRGSTDLTSIQFTNIGLLGMPYWMSVSLENTVISSNSHGGQRNYHVQHFTVLPGRCDIRINVRIPEYVALAAPLHEDCIWRQARGAIAEISSSELATSVDKVGVAQKWFDELDNLAFSPTAVDSNVENEDKCPFVPELNIVHINCVVNLSPGTSEVVVSAVLYLKFLEAGASLGNQARKKLKRLLDLREKLEDDACIELLESFGDIRDVVFMKPLHLKIRLDCGDHPAGKTSKEVIRTDSILDVNFTFD